MYRKIIALMVVVLMVAAAFVAGCGDKKPATEAKKVIRISIGLSETHPEYLGLQKFKEIVESKTKGKYDVQLYANAQLGDDVKATEALRAGTLEMSGPSSSPLPLPSDAAMAAPYSLLSPPAAFSSASRMRDSDSVLVTASLTMPLKTL